MAGALGLSELSMINDLRQLDVISHNLANAHTNGFKRELAVSSFEAALDVNMAGNAVAAAMAGAVPRTHTVVDHTGGALRQTGNPLDIAIAGDAYLQLQGPDGLRYTRSGAFSVDANGRLVASDGYAVNGEEGEIFLRGGQLVIAEDGRMTEDGEYVGQLKWVTFADPGQLVKAGGGLWASLAADAGEPAVEIGIKQGYREASNVSVVDEMVRMMATLRHFESASQVIKGYDEMMGTAVSTIAEL